MPTFPTYDGELPKCLNPLNPRHYLLVLYWVYFRPTALKCYLYQASPEIYKSEGGWKNFTHGIKHSSYRNLFLTEIVLPFFLISIFTSIIYLLSCQFNFDLIVNRLPLFLLLLETALRGAAFGATFGVMLGVATGVMLGVVAGAATFGAQIGVACSIATSISNIMQFRMIFDLMFTAILSVSFGVAISIIFGGRAATMMVSVTTYVTASVMTGAAISVMTDSAAGMTIGAAMGVGCLRIPFYLLESANSSMPKRLRKSHPIVWDELGVLPFAQSQKYLMSQLSHSSENGMNNLSQVIAHPFQSWAVQSAVWSYLEQSESPIEQIYAWVTAKELDRYAVVPTEKEDWQKNISSRSMFFAELAGISLTAKGESVSRFSAIPRILTQRLRHTPKAPFDSLQLFFLLYLNGEGRTRSTPEHLVKQLLSEDLNHFSYGSEVYQSLSNISTYCQFQTTQDIATAPKYLDWINPTDTFLRPTVIQALQTLSTISQSVHRANIASSPLNQRNAILIANDQLQELTTYVTENVHPNYPEQKLLLRIIDRWQSIITKAGGELGRAELLEPIENPYIAGPPVTGSLFVGREDILTQLEELWLRPGQVESVVIFGHRRMGKTSILRNLPGRLTPTTHIINFNVQTLGTLNTQQLILALAQTLYDDLPAHIHIPEPQSTDFPTPEPDFRRWLKKLEPHRRPDDRFIIAIDEFELIEQGIKDGRLSPSLIGHWRGILNDFPWIIFAFAGLHTLQEMTQDYWNPLFGSVKKIPITFLTQPAATRLITNPSEDFPIDYDPDAIDRIYHLTHGQPYLTQLICQNLITRFNRQRFEEQREIEPRFTIADVQTIITEPNFFNDGNAYFRGIWEQAQETQGPAQLAILQNLTDRPLTQTELFDRTNLPPDILDRALKLLIEHDVIQPNDQTQYHYRVELMRQWVARRS